MWKLLLYIHAYVPTGNKIRASNGLHSLLNDITAYPTPRSVESRQASPSMIPPIIPIPHPSTEPTLYERNPTFRPVQPDTNAESHTSYHSTPQTIETYDESPHSSLQGISKAYSNNNDNYSASPSENFNWNLALFTEKCEQNDIYGDQRIQALSVLIRGHLLKFYLDSLKGKSQSIEDIYTQICHRFRSEERSRALIREFYTVPLSIIFSQNATKAETECLSSILARLNDIQMSLPKGYQY